MSNLTTTIPYRRTITGEGFSQLLVKPYNNNTLPKDNNRRRILAAAFQTLQQQHPTEGQAKANNMFINSIFHHLHKLTLQNVSISSVFNSSKNEVTAQCRQSETFCKEFTLSDKRFYYPGCSKRLQNFFLFYRQVNHIYHISVI